MRIFVAILLSLFTTIAAQAHEVRPAQADLTALDRDVTLDLLVDAEPILADVDLSSIANTNESANAADVDRLRALSAPDLAERVRANLDEILSAINLQADGAPVALTAQDITVEDVADNNLPRETRIQLSGTLPEGSESVSLSWPQRYGTLILRQQGVEDPYTGYLQGDDSGPIAIGGGDAQGALATFGSYIPVGFDHILPKGLDHILFVLGLFFLSTRLGPLLWQVSAFTLAHTVTLALGALGIVSIPGSIVEPIIAASIVYVAVENILSKGLSRWRPVVIFVFGLLHGLGFASVLGEFGLPAGQFIPALIGFNIGVEFGQLTVIAGAFVLVWLAQQVEDGQADLRLAQKLYGALALAFVAGSFAINGPGFVETMGAGAPIFLWPLAGLCLLCFASVTFVDRIESYRQFVAVPASVAIALVGAYWFVERVFL